MAVTFDSTDATLNLKLSDDLLTATPLASESLSSLWSGIRSNSCASAGKLFFVVNLVKDLSGDGEGARPECFVGLSTRATPVSQLGSGSSWAYASSGQKWAASKAEAFATTFSAGDRIGCFLDLSSQPCTLSFSRNEIWLGHAFDLQQPDRSQKALYPHILLKYMAVTVDFTGDSLVAGNRWPEEASEYMSWMVKIHDQSFCLNHQAELLNKCILTPCRLDSSKIGYPLPLLESLLHKKTVKSWSWLAYQVRLAVFCLLTSTTAGTFHADSV